MPDRRHHHARSHLQHHPVAAAAAAAAAAARRTGRSSFRGQATREGRWRCSWASSSSETRQLSPEIITLGHRQAAGCASNKSSGAGSAAPTRDESAGCKGNEGRGAATRDIARRPREARAESARVARATRAAAREAQHPRVTRGPAKGRPNNRATALMREANEIGSGSGARARQGRGVRQRRAPFQSAAHWALTYDKRTGGRSSHSRAYVHCGRKAPKSPEPAVIQRFAARHRVGAGALHIAYLLAVLMYSCCCQSGHCEI